mmetsp:Transcript_50010/g.132841  ORF Transcript_50010/g.132841 Transcript_50010/m.132841 type:complete len:213 (-) Transcript_50010:14-652(-)
MKDTTDSTTRNVLHLVLNPNTEKWVVSCNCGIQAYFAQRKSKQTIAHRTAPQNTIAKVSQYQFAQWNCKSLVGGLDNVCAKTGTASHAIQVTHKAKNAMGTAGPTTHCSGIGSSFFSSWTRMATSRTVLSYMHSGIRSRHRTRGACSPGPTTKGKGASGPSNGAACGARARPQQQQQRRTRVAGQRRPPMALVGGLLSSSDRAGAARIPTKL